MAKMTWFSPTVTNNSAPKKIYHHHHDLDVGQTCHFTIICHEVTIGNIHPWKSLYFYSLALSLSFALRVNITLFNMLTQRHFMYFIFSAANRTLLSFGFSLFINDFIDKNAIWRHILSGVVFLFDSEKQSMIRC